MNRTPGVEVSTGSLGQGLSMSLGIALALRLDGLDETAHVFTLLSDGDCQEGQTWEAATAAPHFKVAEPDRDRRLQPPADRRHDRGGHGHRRHARQSSSRSAGSTVEIDGHDMAAIVEALEREPRGRRGRRRSSARPRRAVASRRWRAASASTASHPRRSRPRRPTNRARGTARRAERTRSGARAV